MPVIKTICFKVYARRIPLNNGILLLVKYNYKAKQVVVNELGAGLYKVLT